jgi:Pentapeptide repeats (8 copies)
VKNKLTPLQNAIVLFGCIGILIAVLYQFDWSGFGKYSHKSESIEEVISPKNGEIIKLKREAKYFQLSKTLWDWIGLAGVVSTGTIPFVLYQFQQNQQKLALKYKRDEDERALIYKKAEDERARKLLNEEALQAYFERMSVLLLDKNLKTLSAGTPRHNEALNVARAITLSILRKLNGDSSRKGSVIWFLIELELITQSKLNLSNANLDVAKLRGANLSNAQLSYASFKGANLIEVNLSNAVLSNATFSKAQFFQTNLSGAVLSHADFRYAQLGNSKINLSYAKLNGADLSNANLEGVDLGSANLGGAKLINANLKNVNLGWANLTDTDLDAADLTGAQYLTPSQVKSAKNWHKAKYSSLLNKELGLPEIDVTHKGNQ